jgi:hypothetical protein
MKIFTALTLLILTSGCTHYLYQGDFEAKDNLDNSQQYRLWWTRTDPLIGDDKAGPMILNVACGTAKTFTEVEDGISFVAGSDRFESVSGQTGVELTCGKVTNLSRFLDYQKGDIELSSLCEPKPSDDGFSVTGVTFLSTSQESYRVPINVTEKWSFKDSALSPKPLDCP